MLPLALLRVAVQEGKERVREGGTEENGEMREV